MSENVPVILEFDSVDNTSTDVDSLSDSLNKYSDAAQEAGESSSNAAQTSTMSWTEFYSAYSTVLQVVEKGKEIWNETVGVTVELANTVRQFRDVTGQTSEESSRLVQVLDDYKVSTSAAEMATKKLAKEGLEFNISTLANLSDEYLSLNSDVERTNFLYEKFGKSGTDFVEIMKQGGDAIREASAAIDENLILTDKQLKAARDYEKQVDNLSDTWQGFKVAAGNDAIPYVVNALDTLNKKTEESSLAMAVFTFGWDDVARVFTQTQKDMKVSVEELDKGERDNIETLQEMTTAAEDVAAATAEMSAKNSEFLSSVETYNSLYTSYEENQQGLVEKRKELEAEKQGLIEQGWSEESEKIQDINAKIDENNAKYAENAAAFEVENKKIMLGYLERQLTADGTLDDKELAWLLDKGVAWGVYSQTVVDETRRAMDEANALIEGLVTEKTFTLSLNTIYSTYGDSAQVVGGPRASGGSVNGGMMYPVNERGMPELLTAGGQQKLMMPEGIKGKVTPLSPMSSSGAGGSVIVNIMLDSATPDPERVAYNLAPAVERVLRSKKLI